MPLIIKRLLRARMLRDIQLKQQAKLLTQKVFLLALLVIMLMLRDVTQELQEIILMPKERPQLQRVQLLMQKILVQPQVITLMQKIVLRPKDMVRMQRASLLRLVSINILKAKIILKTLQTSMRILWVMVLLLTSLPTLTHLTGMVLLGLLAM